MLSTSMKLLVAVSAMSAALLMPAHTEATGVCYSPFHAEKYFSDPSAIESVLLNDMAQIAKSTSFAAVRTYHAQFYGQNVIDAVVANGLQVAIGIQMVGANGSAYEYLDNDIAAAISAAKTHPESVLAIYAGNENLINGDFGSTSADDIISVINQVKSALKGTKGANVPVGTVQRLEEWLNAADASRVAAASDVVGVNIYPFFTTGAESDMIGSLDAQWTKMTVEYDATKVRLTETGWPSQGSISDAGNTPSLANAQKYYAAFTQWAAKHSTSTSPFYFMMYDLLKAHATSNYEQHFGVSTAGGALKFDLGSSSLSQSQASSTPATEGSMESAGSSASSLPTLTSSGHTEDAGNPFDSDVAGEADRSADSVPVTTTSTPAPSSTVLVSSAVGSAISSTSSSGSVAATTTNSSTSSVSIPAATTSAPSPGVETIKGSNSTTLTSSINSNSTTTANSDLSVTKSPTETDALPSVDEAGGVANGSGHSDTEDVGFGSSSSASSFSGSIGSSSGSSSSSSSGGASNGPDVGDVDNNAPVSAPDLTPQATAAPVSTPNPSPTSNSSASKDLETQEAQAKRAREVSGKQGWSVQALTIAIGCAGIAAIAVIAVYVQKRRNEESENQISITTADARDSTPSVYSDPLGTRFSSIVMITPNGDGVCIL